ncbi:G2/M phase-specific E3 ubiquitin-protein ligase-like [Haliotis rubra]|uniref:G2/M phase-specific E3 ubiquitin-protein ligase-like n=1 Tax=Haliotis rubra TaxID=36100 RepID=UPI001EE4EEA9|nr:G2/M phase-specific E3 ubiquitin-protein ligase-like [Haliotis rubra]
MVIEGTQPILIKRIKVLQTARRAVNKIHAEIQDFRKGLQDLEMLKYITGSPEATESLSVDTVGPINYRQLKSTYTVHLSPLGSNNRSQEDDTMFAWKDFLRTCESGDSTVAIADILRLWTGSECVPPQGFDNKLSITFVPKRTPAPLPVAHTCGLVLELLRGFDADAFEEKLTYAIK